MHSLTSEQKEFLQLVNTPLKMGFFMFTRLPSAWFAGVRVKKLEPDFAEVTVPFKWFSQNPFRSTYFACLSMAAEMSTGLLALLNIHKQNPPVSMLVTKVYGNYHKKATGKTLFRCTDGKAISEAIHHSIKTGEGVSLETISRGYNENGELVADFSIVWSFKAKKTK